MRFGTTDASGEDVRVVGPTNLSSVDCESFSAAGATDVDSDVNADVVSLKGTVSVGGDVTADEFATKGATDVGGDVTVDELTVSGTTSVGGDVRADRLEAKGASEFGDVRADSASISGTLSVKDLLVDGTAVIRGVVSADRIRGDEVRIALGDDESTVGTIVGGTVSVERDLSEGLLSSGGLLGSDGRLRASTVEGDEVAVEHATVEEVVGEEVRLGPGAEVDVVRAEDLDVDEDATVERTEELG